MQLLHDKTGHKTDNRTVHKNKNRTKQNGNRQWIEDKTRTAHARNWTEDKGRRAKVRKVYCQCREGKKRERVKKGKVMTGEGRIG